MDEKRFKLRDGATAWQQVEGEVILLDLRTSTYLGTNRSASELWAALAEGATRDDLVARLRAVYDVSEVQVGADVDAFLGTCRDRGLLEP